MRRIVALLLVALLAFTLVGCGGGGGEEAETATDANAEAPAAPPTQAPEDDALIPDRSAEETSVFQIFPTVSVPETLAKMIADKQPTIILFVDGAQKTTNDIKKEVNAVMKANQGLAELFTYDLGKYASISKDGTIKVDEAALKEDATAAAAVSLARQLGVSATPFIVVTDDQGYIIFKHRGFIDRDTFEAQVQRTSD
jgi:thioredoxin-related protein